MRFLASSDSSLLGDPDSTRWRSLFLEDLPPELRPLRDSIGMLPEPLRRSTRYGHFRIEFPEPSVPPAPSGQAFLRRAEALSQALSRNPAILEKSARLYYSRWDARYRHPDTLWYTLWLTPSPALDTAACRSVRVLSTGILNDIDSLAWKHSAGKGTDNLIGPFPSAYGTALLRLGGKARGAGKIRFDAARERIRAQMARSMVLGTALGLLQHPVLSEAEIPRNAVHGTALPRFKDKAELIQAVLRMKYGPEGAGPSRSAELERYSERMLQDIYRLHKQERDLGAWMEGWVASPEAVRLGIRL